MGGKIKMSENMNNQLGLGAEIIEQVWDRLRPYELPELREMPARRILVVGGSYDNIEKILANAKIPHTKISKFPKKKDLEQGGKYKDSEIMFVNCDESYHDDNVPYEKGLDSNNKNNIIDFVERGGRMITTDWAQKVIGYLFKNITSKEDALPESVVKIQFPSYIGKNLLGINYENANPKWWIEGSSDIIAPKRNSGITSLITSNELQRDHGSKYLAIGFKHGKGEVFHFVSHLIAQKFRHDNKRDSQNLEQFLSQTNTKVKKANKNKYVTFGGIETTYTLMNTVLELTRTTPILPTKKKTNNKSKVKKSKK